MDAHLMGIFQMFSCGAMPLNSILMQIPGITSADTGFDEFSPGVHFSKDIPW